MFASSNKSKRFMAAVRLGGNNKGNNNLLIVTGVLALLLVLLIYLGPDESGGIRQLLSSSAPDSSSYVPDTNSVPEVIAGNQPAEEPPPLVSDTVKTEASESVKDTAVKNEAEKPEASPDQEKIPVGNTVISYRIKKGDTFFKIAAQFGNNPAELQEMNNMEDMNLQAGKDMKVRVRAMYPVAAGEGMNAIAVKYGVSVRSIKAANGISSETIPSGTTLIIPMK